MYKANWNRRAWLVLLCIGIVCMVVGVMRREHLVVLQKAIQVCLECIGIG